LSESWWQARQSAVAPVYGCFVLGFRYFVFGATAKITSPFAE
jgi:hypothetical protein